MQCICIHTYLYSLTVFLGSSVVKNQPAKQDIRVQSLGVEEPLEKEMAIHSDSPAWEIPCIEEPGKIQSMGSQNNWTRLSD